LLLELLHRGTSIRKLNTRADPTDFEALEKLMRDAIHRTAGNGALVGEYELALHVAGHAEPVTTVVVAA
jgi:hypothetical protein